MSIVPVLIIDPGHGGKDPGGGSNQYWLEKEMVLNISLYQYKRFMELGIPVAMTRASDTYLSPESRTSIVRTSGAKYSISNHINAGGGDGAETIYSIFADSALAREIAEEIRKCGQNVRRTFTRVLPYNSKDDYYFMHRNTDPVNTVIVEYGFADSGRDDVSQIRSNWVLYAEAVVKAFCDTIGYKAAVLNETEIKRKALKGEPLTNPTPQAQALYDSFLPLTPYLQEIKRKALAGEPLTQPTPEAQALYNKFKYNY